MRACGCIPPLRARILADAPPTSGDVRVCAVDAQRTGHRPPVTVQPSSEEHFFEQVTSASPDEPGVDD
jgi:hypothetical protein